MAKKRPRDDDLALREWEDSLNLVPSCRVEVYRVRPKIHRGRRVDGKLGHYDHLPEWEDIRDGHGGGTFRLIVKRPDERGRLVYARSRTLQIAAPPIVPDDAELAFAGDEDRDHIVREIARDTVKELHGKRLDALEQAVAKLVEASEIRNNTS